MNNKKRQLIRQNFLEDMNKINEEKKQQQKLQEKQQKEQEKQQEELNLMKKEDYEMRRIIFYQKFNTNKLDMQIEFLFDCYYWPNLF